MQAADNEGLSNEIGEIIDRAMSKGAEPSDILTALSEMLCGVAIETIEIRDDDGIERFVAEQSKIERYILKIFLADLEEGTTKAAPDVSPM